MKTAIARADITPEESVPLMGYGDSATNGEPLLESGVYGLVANNAYSNGSFVKTVGGTWNSTALTIFLGAGNNNGSPSNYFPGQIQAFVIYNTTITADQVSAVTTAMQAL